MGLRLTPVVGAVGLLLILLRMQRLLRPSLEGLDWRIVIGGALLAGVLVGMVSAWTRARWAFVALAAATASLGLVLRLAVPETLRIGLLPTMPSWQPLAAALAEGWEQVRFGTAPIHPGPELLLVLVPVFVTVGSLWGAATIRNAGWLTLVGVGWFYLLLATVDREAAGMWLLAFIGWTAAGLVALRFDDLRRAERLLGTPTHRISTWAGTAALIVAFGLTGVLAPSIPGAGVVPWRDASTIGGIRTGVSYNLFASTIQDKLVAQSETPVFEAKIGRSPVPADETFWRLITLDRYDGVNWVPTPQPTVVPEFEDVPFETADQRFRGPTESVLAVVRIASLRQNFLPFIGSPYDVDSQAPLLQSGYRTRPDGSIKLDGLTRRGLEYTLTTSVPAVNALDLATGMSANEAPVLREAAAAGLLALSGDGRATLPDLPDRGVYLQLPFDLDSRIPGLAQALVRPAGTPLERALILEAWFRAPGRFTYSVDIEPGHGASELAAWLFEEQTTNYRIGYCENFATAMAVMARSIGLPARLVLGFTPGDVDTEGLITVREKNAHAWVEVWLDGVGWVGFDPTPRSDGANPATGESLGFDILALAESITLPEDEEIQAGLAPSGDGIREGLEEDVATPDALPGFTLPGFAGGFDIHLPTAVWWVLGGFLLLGVIPAAKRLRRFTRIRRAKRGDIGAAWAEITDRLRDMGEPISVSMTPLEVSGLVGAAIGPLSRAHQQNEYGPTPPTRAERLEAIEALARVETGFRRHPLPERIVATWRLRSFRRTKERPQP